MDNNKANQIANQTEVPVTNLPPNLPQSNSKIPKLSKLPIVPILLAFFILAGIAGAILYFNSVKQSQQNTARLKADDAFAKGDYDKASRILDEALGEKDNDPKLLASAIKVIASKGNQSGQETKTFQEAKDYIDKALKADPEDLDVLLAAGYAYETSGNYKKALEYYDIAVKEYPTSADAWFQHAHVNEFLGNRDLANKEYDKAYSIDPDHPLVLMVQGNRFLAIRKVKESMTSFRRAADSKKATNQTRSDALAALSRLTRGNGDFEEALVISKQAIDADPNFSPALATHGYNLAVSGNPKEGIDYLKKSVAANPRITNNYNNLAQVYRANKNYTEAINFQKEAIARVGDDNTILTPDAKKARKGLYIYDLAKTYDMSGLQVDTLSILQQSLDENIRMKELLISDHQRLGFFKSLSGNEKFVALLK